MPFGFGASTRFQGTGNQGFGANQLGAGSPPVFFQPSAEDISVSSSSMVPDDGGEVVLLAAPYWPIRTGYSVKLHRLGLYWDCYSGNVGDGLVCSTEPGRRILAFVLPPVPVGVYDIVVDWGPTRTVVNALTVVARSVCLQGLDMRVAMPSHWSTGSLRHVPDVTFPTAPLETWTRGLGQVHQQLQGPSTVTRTSTDFVFGDTTVGVESVLGLPTSGTVWVGPDKYTYTHLVGGALIGMALAGTTTGEALLVGTRVVLG